MFLCRNLENVESKIIYTTRGKSSVCYTSRVGVFFERSFRVTKVVLKLIGEIVEDDKLLLYDFPVTTITAINKVDMF